MNNQTLQGCKATPLAGYLKALGVLRTLASKYPDTRAFWRKNTLVLNAPVNIDEIAAFFLNEYSPTPIMTPWNAGSGFYFRARKIKSIDPITGEKRETSVRDAPTTATKIVDKLLATTGPRLADYREGLQLCKATIQKMGLETAPASGQPKDRLIQTLRTVAPDRMLDWLDAALLITGETTRFPPLLGSGGNDGNLDFSSNFIQRLLEVLPEDGKEPHPTSQHWLQAALHGTAAPNMTRGAIGQFFPGNVGGPNSTTGFDSKGKLNPWDFILMMEGALLFAAAAVRRNADDPHGALSYPFTVRAVGAGAGTLGEGDASSARGELWMPLWSKPASFTEVRTLLSEGRVALGRKPARDALDFVRAVHQLGSYRGLDSFQRYSLLQRSGTNHLAAPLGQVTVSTRPQSYWLDELDQYRWLDRYRRYANDGNTATRYKILRKRLEDQLFKLAGKPPSRAETQQLLVLLGQIQRAVSTSSAVMEKVSPIPLLSEQWAKAANDGSSAFRIAAALAGLYGSSKYPLPMRSQLFPVNQKQNRWIGIDKGTRETYRIHGRLQGRLVDILPGLLSRRLWLASQYELPDLPMNSPAGVTLSDLEVFLHSPRLDRRINDLLAGLSLCRIPRDTSHSDEQGFIPPAFALMKLCLETDRRLQSIGVLPAGRHLPVPAGMLAQLVGGNHRNRATATAWRRLHSSGLSPLFAPDTLPRLAGVNPVRAAAALMIPLRFGATANLTRSVLAHSKTQQPQS